MESFYTYIPADGAELFTVVILPDGEGKFPVIIGRSPYVDDTEELTEEEITAKLCVACKMWIDNGYAQVFQHCRGRGKSTGACIPYINEREDGLQLQEWIRNQDFYNGEMYLEGSSYTSSVHFVTAPFADDIKGAVLRVQDCERYNCNYRNGFYKMNLHGDWYVNMYKHKSIRNKNFVMESYNMLPLLDFSKTVFGESADDFDEILKHPDRNDPFWSTRYGGGEAHNAIKSANIPILLVTGFYDIYTGGTFDMWNTMDEEIKSKCALAVHPFCHSGFGESEPVNFENGRLESEYGDDYALKWIEAIRGKCEFPIKQGKVSYYRLFDNCWHTEDFEDGENEKIIQLGSDEISYVYNPYAPASFKGGLSANFGGNEYQDEPNSRYDIISLFSDEFTEDYFVKGKMKAKLCVKSDCEDTCFYIRLSLDKKEGAYGLRDDIQQISNFDKEYKPNSEIMLDFAFDEHAFKIHKGERLRIDISSSAFPHYVRHTNQKGLFCEQKTAKIAHNTIICDKSYLKIYTE